MFDIKLKADLSDLKALTKKYPEASRQARVSKITEALQLLEREVVKKTPYGAGPIHLREAYTEKVSVSGDKVIGIFGNPLEHGEPVESGSKPHFPPVGPIKFWVEKQLGLSGDEAESVAYAIAVTISRRGTKGAKMVEKGFDASEARIMRMLKEIPAEIIRILQ